MRELNNFINPIYQIDIVRIFHQTTASRTFFKTNHMLGHKESPNRNLKIEITSWILSDHHGLKMDINKTETIQSLKIHISWTTHYWIKTRSRQKSRRNLKTFFKKNEWKWKHNISKSTEQNEGSCKKHVYSTKKNRRELHRLLKRKAHNQNNWRNLI